MEAILQPEERLSPSRILLSHKINVSSYLTPEFLLDENESHFLKHHFLLHAAKSIPTFTGDLELKRSLTDSIFQHSDSAIQLFISYYSAHSRSFIVVLNVNIFTYTNATSLQIRKLEIVLYFHVFYTYLI